MKKFLILILIIYAPFLLIRQTFAQSQPYLIVSPSINFLDLQSDPPEITLTYQNTSKFPIELTFSAEDFTQLEDSWKVTFLDQQHNQNYKYRLSPWISFEKQSLRLDPGGKDSVKIFIDEKRLTKGGHYAMILAEMNQADKTKGVTVKGKIASLIFVRTATGNEIEEGKINFLNPLRDGWKFPEKFVLRFENLGDVELIPYGTLQVKDMFGTTVAKGIVNEGSNLTLPESIKRYDIQVSKSAAILLPGFYTATLQLEYGKSHKALTITSHFFSEGSVSVIEIGAVVVVIIGGLIIWKKRR